MTVPTTLEEALEVIEDLKADNARVRKNNRQLKADLEDVGDAPTKLADLQTKVQELETKLSEAEGFKTKYEELSTQFEEVNTKAQKAEREAKLKPMLIKLGVQDEKALELAFEKLGVTEEDKYEDAAKKVVADYPFLVSKQAKSVPDTGKSNHGKLETPTSIQGKLEAGIAERLATINN